MGIVEHLHVQTLINVRVCVILHFLSYKTSLLQELKKKQVCKHLFFHTLVSIFVKI